MKKEHTITKDLFRIINIYGETNGCNVKKGTCITKYKGYKYCIDYVNDVVLKVWKIYPFEDREIDFKKI